MTEVVTVTPQAAIDENDDPLPAGEPFTVPALIAPGNTMFRPGADGQLDVIDFTAYLPLMIQQDGAWVRTATLLTDKFTITIRDQVCIGRAKEWNDNGRGGIEVLATIRSGANP